MRTTNLRLIPLTPAHWRALIEGVDVFEKRFDLRVAAGIFGDFSGTPAEFLARIQTATVADQWRDGFVASLGDSNLVVGACGFKGPPGADGVVEIAYGIASEYRGRGFATELAQALTAHAFDSGLVRMVCAHTSPEPNASTKVLKKSGFTRAADVIDPEDGLVWRWEKQRPST